MMEMRLEGEKENEKEDLKNEQNSYLMQQKEKTAAIASKKIYSKQFQDSKQVKI